MRRGGRAREAFTLLEVMVAVAILAVAMTAIFSSEGGAIKVHHRARKTTVATLLARCKMGEIEELLAKEGLPAIEEVGSDGCCEDAEQEGFGCDWSVVRVELPEPSLEGDALGLDEAAEGGGGAEGIGSGADLEGILGGTGGGDMMGELAMQYAYPILKPAIEEQVRRVDITVKWLEGNREHSFQVSQYVVQTPEEQTR